MRAYLKKALLSRTIWLDDEVLKTVFGAAQQQDPPILIGRGVLLLACVKILTFLFVCIIILL